VVSGVASGIKRERRNGELEGMFYTERDVDFIRMAARWWCVTADLYLRYTEPRGLWLPEFTNDEQSEWYKKKYYNLRRRFNKLATIDRYAPLNAMMPQRGLTAYWCTPAGGELIGAPWTQYPYGNISRGPHAWAACDIGMFLEERGVQVYSEREFARGETVDHHEVHGGKFVNAIEGSKSPNPDHGMRPDLAIPSALDGDDRFILLEVERKVGRGMKDYRRKMESYYAHDRVGALWYLVENPVTAKNIKALHEELAPLKRDMPVRVLRLNINDRFYAQADAGLQSSVCAEDLAMMGHTLSTEGDE